MSQLTPEFCVQLQSAVLHSHVSEVSNCFICCACATGCVGGFLDVAFIVHAGVMRFAVAHQRAARSFGCSSDFLNLHMYMFTRYITQLRS